MGNMTVALILNDVADSLWKNPQSTAALIRICTSSGRGSNDPNMHKYIVGFPNEFPGESFLHSQAMEILPCFHASQTKFYMVGQNRITESEIKSYGKCRKTGRKTVTLYIEDEKK